MEWARIEQIMVTISFVMTLAVVAVFVYKKYKYRIAEKLHKKKLVEESSENESPEDVKTNSTKVHLYDLRQFKYNGFDDMEKLDFKAFFIDENENEALGIFVSVSPVIISTLTKLEKALLHIDTVIGNEETTDDDLVDKVKIVNDALNTLLDVTDNLSAKLYSIYSSSSIETTEVEVNAEVIKAYIDIVHNMLAFAFDYLNVNNIIRLKVKQTHPHVERDFVRATERFLNIFFVDLMNCINMLDKSIEAYR